MIHSYFICKFKKLQDISPISLDVADHKILYEILAIYIVYCKHSYKILFHVSSVQFNGNIWEIFTNLCMLYKN